MGKTPGMQRGVGATEMEARVAADSSARASPPGDRLGGLVVAIAVVAATLTLVVSMIVLLHGPSYEHYSDTALIELRTFDVGHHTPQLGPFSRFTWTHPGPMLFLL